MKTKAIFFAVIAAVILLIVAVGLFWQEFPKIDSDYMHLSAIVLVGLGLTVILMAVLVIVYAVLGISDQTQALGLPEGSVRALLAFSLVLIFVCLAAFLFSSINTQSQGNPKTLTSVNDAQLSDLKSNFIVAAEQAKENGKLLYEQVPGPNGGAPVDDLNHPLYSVAYYPKPNPNAADMAKQIFTTLATIFVSVVSFYFGSSVTASAVGAGAKAAIGGGGGASILQGQLTSALAESHNAQAAYDNASAALSQAQAQLSAAPDDGQKQAAVQAAQKALDDVKSVLEDKQAKVQSAQKAVNDAKGQGS